MDNNNLSQEARNYKRTVAGSFMLVDGNKINEKITGSDFIVTRKYDGIMTYISFRNGNLEAYNSGGQKLPETLPCLLELKASINAKGVTTMIIAAELFAVINPDGRERVADTLSVLADPQQHDTLKLAIFDLVSFEGVSYKQESYRDKLRQLKEYIVPGKNVRVVRGTEVQSRHEVEVIFKKLVEEKGAEGIVVHSDLHFVYKIKPRHTFDAVIIGFTSGEDSRSAMVRDVLLAVMHPDGTLQQIASVGTGFSDEQRENLYKELSADIIASDYITTDSRNIAFRMVKPRVVVEFATIDCVTENSAGEPKLNMLLEFSDTDGIVPVMKTPGVAIHSPSFVRFRDDKQAVPSDVRVSQLTDVCAFTAAKVHKEADLPKSTILSRRVFIKKSGVKRMVQKFVVWHTNKEQTGEYPAYVLHHTDYNYSRKEQLKRDLRISSSHQQIMSLLDEMISVNITKGWEEVL